MIDIIIPVYNVANYLRACVQSVLEQDFHDWNITLIDDGSTDSSGCLCDELAKKDKRIKCIHKPNGGLSSARNAGLEATSGSFVLFLDSDDTLMEGALSRLFKAAEESGADIVCGGYNTIDESGEITGPFGCYEEYLDDRDRFTFVYGHSEVVMAWGKLFRRSIWNEIRFPEGRLHEDVFVYHQYASLANAMLFIDKPVILYRKRSDSITGRDFCLRNFDAVDGLRERIHFFKEKGDSALALETAKYLSRYLLLLIHKMDLHNRGIRRRLLDSYRSNVQQYPAARIPKFKWIVLAYKLGLFRKPFFSIGIIRNSLRLKKVIKKPLLLLKLAIHRIFSPGCYVLISTPTHGNLGDQAIVMAERKFLKKYGRRKGIVEVNADDYRNLKTLISKFIKKADTIIVDGGGNIGSIWPYEASRINDIVLRFPHNKIVIFPETAFFEKSYKGSIWYEKTKKAFSSHANLFLFLRDEASFSLMRSMLPSGNIYLCPDIVLSLDRMVKKRKGEDANALILLCLRSDQERRVGISPDHLKKGLSSERQRIETTSTVLNERIVKKNRQKKVLKKIREFHEADLVITDRMHGMLFAFLANTPCIAFDNISGKVLGQYKWIAGCGFVQIALDIPDFEKLFESLSQSKIEYNSVRFNYSNLISAIRG